MKAFAPRDIEFEGTRTVHGWTLKLYGVHLPEEPVDWPAFHTALDLAAMALPGPQPDVGRPGLGVFIAHQGATGDYAVLGWWNHENELPFHIMVRRGREEPWRKAVEGESICVWDLEIIWEERQAWIATMLAGAGADRGEYLRRVPERFLRGGGG